MKKGKMISLLTALAMLSPWALPALAETGVAVGGAVLYSRGEEGTHTVTVCLEDINGNGSLSSTFNITGVKAEAVLEAVIDNPNTEIGGSVPINVYYGGEEVTESADFSGAVYENGKITPAVSGLNKITISYQGQSVTVPVAVNDPNENVAEVSSIPVFTEDFEGNSETLKTTYGGNNANIAVETVSCSADKTTDNALKMTTGTLSTTVFGPEYLTDYVLEYDSLCTAATGSSASFYGATMRANSKHGGYKIGVAPVMKYNPKTHKVDTSSGYTDNSRKVTAAYSDNSANAGNWHYAGFSDSALQASVSQGQGAKWIHHRSTVVDNVIQTKLNWRTSSTVLKEYRTEISGLNTIAGKDGYAAGGTTLATHGNTTYFDNIKIYRINKYKDIKINTAEADGVTTIALSGIDAENNETELKGSVTASAYGAVGVEGVSYTSYNGIGYVAVTYKDEYGNIKHKVVKTGEIQPGDADEFTIVSAPALLNENSEVVTELIPSASVYASATLIRGSLDGDGVGMYIGLYDKDTNTLDVIYKVSADAIQRVGDKIELRKKFVLPDGADKMYARIYLWNSSLVPLTDEIFGI